MLLECGSIGFYFSSQHWGTKRVIIYDNTQYVNEVPRLAMKNIFR